MKKAIKEIIILILLALAIILILGVLLYDIVPTNKIIPEKVSYVTPEDVKNEIATSQDLEQASLNMVYEIDSTDLSNYKKTQDYVAGKKNPFASLEEDTNEANNTQNQSTNNTNNTNTSSSSTSNSSNIIEDEEEGYLPNKGTK